MKHRVAGRKLGRTSAHRLALLRNLSSELFSKERVTTTLMKAKELRPFAEKLLTLCKRESLHARRLVLRHVHDRDVVAKMFDTLSARYAQRPGGYTRIIKLGPRRGDNAEMALIELVGAESASTAAKEKEKEAAAAAEKPGKGARKAKGAAPEKEPEKPEAKPRARKAGARGTAKPKADTKAKSKGKAAGGAATRKTGKSGS